MSCGGPENGEAPWARYRESPSFPRGAGSKHNEPSFPSFELPLQERIRNGTGGALNGPVFIVGNRENVGGIGHIFTLADFIFSAQQWHDGRAQRG